MNFKQKYHEFIRLFHQDKIQKDASLDSSLTDLVLRIFIETSFHLNKNIKAFLNEDKKTVNFLADGQKLNINYYRENKSGVIVSEPIVIKSGYIKNIDDINDFYANNKYGRYDIDLDNYDGLLLDRQAKKSSGAFFTGNDLAHLTNQFFKTTIPHQILKQSLFYDPAAGVGNLLVAQENYGGLFGSDINEQNQQIMRQRNIVVPANTVNFLLTPTNIIIANINHIRNKIGNNISLFILTNPPFHGKNSWLEGKEGVAATTGYLDKELVDFIRINNIRSADLSSFFLLKALLVFKKGGYRGYLGMFSPTNWLYPGRTEHGQLKNYVFSQTKFTGGFLVDGSKFFKNLKSRLDVAFSIFEIDTQTKQQVPVDKIRYYNWCKESRTIRKLFSLKNQDSFSEYKALMKKLLDKNRLTDFSENAFKNVFFKDIFRAINCQTGDDKHNLMHYGGRMDDVDLDLLLKNKKIDCDDIRVVAVDKKNSYDLAIKPKTRKNKGCPFQIPRKLDGPAMAWHYLWGYLPNYPTRFYNAPPITKKYAYTFIDHKPLLTVDDVRISRSCKSFFYIENNKEVMGYIADWQRKIGDLRGLIFFFAALTWSKTARSIANQARYKNCSIWCPDLKTGNIGTIKKVVQLGLIYTLLEYKSKFRTFKICRKNEIISDVVNYFDIRSDWFSTSTIYEYLLESDYSRQDFETIIFNGDINSLKNQMESLVIELYGSP